MSLLLTCGAGCNEGAGGGGTSTEDSGTGEGTEGEDETDPEPEEEPQGERITGIGVGGGPDELSYAGLDSEEMDVWGPGGYVVDHLGLNWIGDGPGHKVLVIDDDGQIVDRYDLEGLVRGLHDIEVTETYLYVLTVGGDTPVIARINRNNADPSAWETFEVPADNLDTRSVTGLRKDANGVVSVELVFGREYLPLFGADGNFIASGLPTAVYEVDGHTVELMAHTGEDGQNVTHGTILVDAVEVAAVDTIGMLGDFYLIGSTPDGDLWIRVGDVGISEGAFLTRMYAYRFGLDGSLKEVVQLPMREELVWVEHRITIEPEGDVRVLSTGIEEVSLRRPVASTPIVPFELPPGVTPYVPGDTTAMLAGGQELAPTPLGDENSCMSRAEMLQRAYEFVNYQAVYNQQHMQTCSGRTPVSYFQQRLGQPIRGVAYKYAGHMEVSTYHNAVVNNRTIGDLNTKDDKNVDNCSAGVDCSGFVSKVWRCGHKTTRNIEGVSQILSSTNELKPGDALNKWGSHVRLVEAFDGNWGVKVVEATVGSERMRVIARSISWGDAGSGAGYKPIRYNNVCPDAPPPPPPKTAHVIFDVSGYLPANSGYVPLPPTRLLDTRQNGQEHVGPLLTDEVISVSVAGRAGLPDAGGIGAVVLNTTVAQPQGNGFLAVYPDANYPGTSNINFVEYEAAPALVIIDPGADGKIEIQHVTTNGGSDVLVDVFGYFPPSADVHMVTPTRVFDSRTMEFGAAKVAAGTRNVQLAGVGGIPNAGVSAVIANLTAINPDAPGYATIYAAGTAEPQTSNLNYVAGVARANLVIVQVSAEGFATLYTHESAHYAVDVLGWFGEGVDFEPIAPLRLRDTRVDDAGPLGPDESIAIHVFGQPTIPDGVMAIFGNVTAAQPTTPGYLQVYPDAVPATSNVNFVAGKVVSNAVLTEVSNSGIVHVKAKLP